MKLRFKIESVTHVLGENSIIGLRDPTGQVCSIRTPYEVGRTIEIGNWFELVKES